MKKLVLTVFLCIGFSIFAQETTAPPKKKANKEAHSPEKRNETRLNKMTTELNLNAKQQEQVKQIIAEQMAKMEGLKTQQKANKEAGIQLTDDEKKALKNKMKMEKEANEAQFKSILSPEQFEKYQQMQKEQREKMMEMRKTKQNKL